jgi:hypothetical protein
LPNFGYNLNTKVILWKTSFYNFLPPTLKNVKKSGGFFLKFGKILAVENLKKHLFFVVLKKMLWAMKLLDLICLKFVSQLF